MILELIHVRGGSGICEDIDSRTVHFPRLTPGWRQGRPWALGELGAYLGPMYTARAAFTAAHCESHLCASHRVALQKTLGYPCNGETELCKSSAICLKMPIGRR